MLINSVLDEVAETAPFPLRPAAIIVLSPPTRIQGDSYSDSYRCCPWTFNISPASSYIQLHTSRRRPLVVLWRKRTSFSQLRATPKTPATHPYVGGPENAQALETGFAFGSDRDFAGRALPLCNLYLATSGLPTECTNQNSLPNRRLPHPHPLPPPCLYLCHQPPTSTALSINSVSPIVAMS